MLLYVDKKKQKRQKIKVTCFILTFIFIVLANILHFNTTLHQAQNSLTKYQTIQTKHDWFYSSNTIQIFTKKNKKEPLIIIVPQNINRETAEILSCALSKVTPNTAITISPSLANHTILQALIQQIIPSLNTTPSNNLLITDNVKNANTLIHKEKLHPSFLTYKNTEKNSTQVKNLIDQLFPLPQKPSNSLEQELSSLKEFTTIYKNEIKKSLSPNNKHTFTSHGFFLKNANICINYNSEKACEINSNNSLEKNIKNILQQNIDITKITHINLLTTFQEITDTDILEQNEGIILQFENRKEVLLPKEIKNISKKKTPFYIIKEKLGVNPNYTSPNMKYYKFKTLEIEINDNI